MSGCVCSSLMNWLVVSNIFFIFTTIWGNFPFLLIFSIGLKPPTSCYPEWIADGTISQFLKYVSF